MHMLHFMPKFNSLIRILEQKKYPIVIMNLLFKSFRKYMFMQSLHEKMTVVHVKKCFWYKFHSFPNYQYKNEIFKNLALLLFKIYDKMVDTETHKNQP